MKAAALLTALWVLAACAHHNPAGQGLTAPGNAAMLMSAPSAHAA